MFSLKVEARDTSRCLKQKKEPSLKHSPGSLQVHYAGDTMFIRLFINRKEGSKARKQGQRITHTQMPQKVAMYSSLLTSEYETHG